MSGATEEPGYRTSVRRHPALSLVSALVTGFVPLRVGFLHRFFWSKSPKYACVFARGLRAERVRSSTDRSDPMAVDNGRQKQKAVETCTDEGRSAPCTYTDNQKHSSDAHDPVFFVDLSARDAKSRHILRSSN